MAHGRLVLIFALSFEVEPRLSVVKQLALKHICDWSGNNCAVNVMKFLVLGDASAVHLGCVHYLDENAVDRAVEGLREVSEG